MRRILITGAAGLAVLVGSFFTTLWVLDLLTPIPERIATLSMSTVSDETSSRAAADAAGLRLSTDIVLAVDVLVRSGQKATMSGWTLEQTPPGIARGKPNTIMVFSGGASVASVESSGERPDVSSALKLSGPITKVLAYNATLACAAGTKIVAVAITVTGLYSAPYVGSCP